MQIDLHTNVQPIVAGDDISISIHLDTWEAFSTVGYGVYVTTPMQRTLASFVPLTKGFDYPWTVDVVGQQVVFQVILYPVVHSAFSAPVTITPAVPVLTAPEEDELLHAGGQYTFRWTQVPPAPTSYRLRFSTDGAQTLPQLGNDFAGNVDHVTRTVDLTRNGGQSWTTLASNVPGSQHHITVGVDPPVSTHCRVRVEAFGGAHTTTATSGVFHIAGAPVRHGGSRPRD